MKVTPDSNVYEVLEKYPQLIPVFTKQGHCFGLLANPALRATMAKMVTIKTACALHFLDLNKLMKDIDEELSKGAGKTK
ncbi:MAG: DUF1858 domain-containing protein [Nitrospirota bacterium]|nr:DUF1858 domain-containing protein [Nitrospirota bacterium]